MLAEKVGDLQQAAQKLSDVVRLYPRDDKALDTLASVFANPQWTGADGPERAVGLYSQIARRRHEAGDVDNAVAALRKALTAMPGHPEASALMERVLTHANRLADLDRFLRERVATAHSDQEKIEVLFKRAQLARTSLNDIAEAMRIYQEIVAIEPAGGTASQELATLYLERQDFGKLAELRERQLEKATDPEFRLKLQRELASLYRDRLGDREQAAVYLHAILQTYPSDPKRCTPMPNISASVVPGANWWTCWNSRSTTRDRLAPQHPSCFLVWKRWRLLPRPSWATSIAP